MIFNLWNKDWMVFQDNLLPLKIKNFNIRINPLSTKKSKIKKLKKTLKKISNQKKLSLFKKNKKNK